MKKNNISKVVGVILALFLSILFANAVQNFSVSTTSITDTTILTKSDSSTFTITNNGNESINLTISKVDLTLNSGTVVLALNQSTITNLKAGNSTTINVSYTPSGVPKGTYTGSIKVVNAQNSSMTKTISYTLNVIGNGESLQLVTYNNDKITFSGQLNERDSKLIKFRNNGNVTLTNLQFTVTNLQGDVSNDDIRKSDITFNDDGFTLKTGESDRIDLKIDIPKNIEIDTYTGTITATSDEGFKFSYTLEVVVTGGNIDIQINENRYNVKSNILKVIGEPGDYITNYEFEISNEGNVNINNVQFELGTDLVEEFTSSTIPKSSITFSPSTVDLKDSDNEIIGMNIEIPEGTSSGTYFSDIKAVSSSGKVYDSIRLEVKVIGDVYIKSITYDKQIEPGKNLDVEITVKNQGSKVQRNLKIRGTLFDIDYGNSDVLKSSSPFLLNVGDEKTQTLRFKIPDEASDGSHTLELRLNYGTDEVVEVKELIVVRPTHKINFESSGINPAIVKCDDSIYSFVKVKNLGKFDEDVKFITEIVGEGIKEQSNTISLNVDETYQNNHILDVKNLKAGTYTVLHKVIYNSNLVVKEESLLKVDTCNSATIGGIDIKAITPQINQTNTSTVNLFGTDLKKSTVYLGGGIASVFVLILVSLFFL